MIHSDGKKEFQKTGYYNKTGVSYSISLFLKHILVLFSGDKPFRYGISSSWWLPP